MKIVHALAALLFLGAMLYLVEKFIAANQPPLTERQTLEATFARMANENKWDVAGNLRWEFTFSHPTRAPLEEVAAALVAEGYTDGQLFYDAGAWRLSVAKVEHHTVDSFVAREAQLLEFASRHGVKTYDGWKAGPAPSATPTPAPTATTTPSS
jgi:hypothetical protein